MRSSVLEKNLRKYSEGIPLLAHPGFAMTQLLATTVAEDGAAGIIRPVWTPNPKRVISRVRPLAIRATLICFRRKHCYLILQYRDQLEGLRKGTMEWLIQRAFQTEIKRNALSRSIALLRTPIYL